VKCPFCAHLEDKVIDSRTTPSGDVIRRRRECEKCEKRFTTYERLEYTMPTVVKKDGRREAFDRKKIMHSVAIACNKRPVAVVAVEALCDRIEREFEQSEAREIATATIGERVMSLLHDLDGVAYVRFASVYRSFRDIGEFADELNRLKRGSSPAVVADDIAESSTESARES
jgi:transcriptional repressor NrdR